MITYVPCTNLTALEAQVLDALKQGALDCSGGSFACLEEVNVKGLGRKALGGVVTSLQEKGVIDVSVTKINQRMTRWGKWTGGTKVTQVTIFGFGE
jgi:hypothetical protein